MEERLKAIEVELAYLRKSIEELKKIRTVEVHYHYMNDYSGLAELLLYFNQEGYDDDYTSTE